MLAAPTIVGRYALYGEIASGGMATVHYGRLIGEAGFSRTVAVKRLHAHLSKDPEFATMFLDEARLAARVQHPNVVPTIDVVAQEGELSLVLEYVHGESLARLHGTLRRRSERMPTSFATTIVTQVLLGLHAAHEATNEHGEPLGLVHRDVSPQNVMVGLDGISRVLDFGVAKAAGRIQTTRQGQIKGKIAYMAPEQARAGTTDRRTDIYGASIILWELLSGRRLFAGSNDAMVLAQLLDGVTAPPSATNPEVTPALDAIVMRGLAQNPAARFQTAREMAIALEEAAPMASARKIGDWVGSIAEDQLTSRSVMVREIEKSTKDAELSLRDGSPISAPREVAQTPAPAALGVAPPVEMLVSEKPPRPDLDFTIRDEDDDDALTAAMVFPPSAKPSADPANAITMEPPPLAPVVATPPIEARPAIEARPQLATRPPSEPRNPGPPVVEPAPEPTSQVSQVSSVTMAGTAPPPAPRSASASRGLTRSVALAIIGGLAFAVLVLLWARPGPQANVAAPARSTVVIEVPAPPPTPTTTSAPVLASAEPSPVPSEKPVAEAPKASADVAPPATATARSAPPTSPAGASSTPRKVRPAPIKFTDPG